MPSDRRGVPYAAFDLKQAAFDNVEGPRAKLYFNQASPSAYVRGHARAVPLALAYMRTLERRGARVLNGADVFALELSKSAQATLLHTLGIDTPRSITFNDVRALRSYERTITWPALLKPDQGGSGARIQVVNSLEEVEGIFEADPNVWLPDNLFLLQEYLPHDPDVGIVRLEFLGGGLLYAMRVKTHGRFNLCPSPVCNPDDGDGTCEVPDVPVASAPPVEFYPYPDVPRTPSRRRPPSCVPRDWTLAASSTWRHRMGVACSTTSTRTRTCAHPWPRRSASTPSSEWLTICRRNCLARRVRFAGPALRTQEARRSGVVMSALT